MYISLSLHGGRDHLRRYFLPPYINIYMGKDAFLGVYSNQFIKTLGFQEDMAVYIKEEKMLNLRLNLTIRALLAPRYALFSLHTIFTEGTEGPFRAPRYTQFPLHTIFIQGPKGPFRVLEKASR